MTNELFFSVFVGPRICVHTSNENTRILFAPVKIPDAYRSMIHQDADTKSLRQFGRFSPYVSAASFVAIYSSKTQAGLDLEYLLHIGVTPIILHVVVFPGLVGLLLTPWKIPNAYQSIRNHDTDTKSRRQIGWKSFASVLPGYFAIFAAVIIFGTVWRLPTLRRRWRL